MRTISVLMVMGWLFVQPAAAERFEGQYIRGSGDREYLELLDISMRMFRADPQFQNVPMLYEPSWNGLVEGPTWGMWWIQNSYGPTYCALPFFDEPLSTFLQNAQDLWFDQMGDGKTSRPCLYFNGKMVDATPPDGCLCDAASLKTFIAKQGDGRVDIHDWCFEFTAAGLLLQAELLLINRDRPALDRYLPKLERCANFIESRRDPKNNLFLAGPAANLLAPSYAGWKHPDGTYGQAYLTGLSITYIAALDRLIELYKMVGDTQKAQTHQRRRDSAQAALPQLLTDEGYFIKYLDPDGTRHGVYGAPKHGYFEAAPNHDAIAFRVVDEEQAKRIYAKIAAIAGLRPHAFILANYPGLDDLYTEPTGLWRFGYWVNGGHWSTCEARMIMAYYRLGQYEDARRSMRQLLTFARRFRMDNPLTEFGSEVYQPNRPINLCYDAFGPPAAMIRGLFEYLYQAEGLTLIPHVPAGITQLQQRFPILFGTKRLYLAVSGQGPVTQVFINDRPCTTFTPRSVFLPYAQTPDEAVVEIVLGDGPRRPMQVPATLPEPQAAAQTGEVSPDLAALRERAAKWLTLAKRLDEKGLGRSYEAAHARLAADYVATIQERRRRQAAGEIKLLPEPSQAAADKVYLETAQKLGDGLERVLQDYAKANDPRKQQIYQIWKQ